MATKFEVEGVFKLRKDPSVDAVRRDTAAVFDEIKTGAEEASQAEQSAAAAGTAAARQRNEELRRTTASATAAGTAVASIGSKFFQVFRAATVFSGITAIVTGLVTGLGAVASRADDTRSALSSLGSVALRALEPVTGVIGRVIDKLDALASRGVSAIQRLLDPTGAVKREIEAAARASDRWASAIVNTSKLSSEAVRILEAQGISLDTVNAKIREHEQSIRTLTKAYETGLLSEEKWREGTERLRDAIESLRAGTDGVGPSITVYRDTIETAAEAADLLAESELEAAAGAGSLGAAAAAAASGVTAIGEAARITTGELDRMIETGNRALAIEEALARGGRLVNAGTRIRVAGGSRLTRAPGLGGSSRESRFISGLGTLT